MKKYLYLDESGNSGLHFSKEGVSKYFVVAGILFEESNSDNLINLSRLISKKYFSNSEIKSSNIGNDIKRRKEILNEIIKGDFHIYAIIFNKQSIFKNGLKYKRSFYKYLNKIAYKTMYDLIPSLSIRADEHGSKEFMESFSLYISKNFKTSHLFSKSDFKFENSKSNPITQIADFVAGTIAKHYENELDPKEILFPIINSNKLLPIQFWPKQEYGNTKQSEDERLFPYTDLDNIIFDISQRSSKVFIDENSSSKNEEILLQVETCKIFLFNSTYGNRGKYIPTTVIVNQLNIDKKRITEKQFGRTVIGPLRDSNVFITSNTNGYKLITSEADLREFIKYFDHFIKPMIKRIKKYRETILIASQNQIDFLDSKDYDYLKIIMENV
ncbi:DUF3800 domain-containing protein [Leptospira vanthielii]|uniref:DUF3800 domain-containing protein n=1 Tax=Leptospira vanthielii TaxID=293085 RepID=A0ABY2NSS4_9LEPT|nr:DUF3800 domain-containing protein [Leptospira vanthielii]TGM60065.1 DUF3800 domain-containing protein [Leptospira vanthielii]